MEPTDLVKLVDDTLLLLEREMNKYRVTVERASDRAAGHGQRQPDSAGADEPADQRPAGDAQRRARSLIRLSHDAEPKAWSIWSVRDNGCGIPPDKLPQIFDRFFTTKSGPDASGKGGTGLGLSMCRDIIEAHHGRIRVDSTVGKGTAFTLKLPVAKFPEPATLPLGMPATRRPKPRPAGDLAANI